MVDISLIFLFEQILNIKSSNHLEIFAKKVNFFEQIYFYLISYVN